MGLLGSSLEESEINTADKGLTIIVSGMPVFRETGRLLPALVHKEQQTV